MIPATFDYETADSVEHAVELLGRHGEEAKLLAGGQSLLNFLRLRVSQPSALVDLGRVPGLDEVRDEGDRLAIGALVRHADAARDATIREHCPIVAHAAGEIGDPQVRNMGTVGGSVAHGDPAADLPAVLVALDAEVVLRGPDGERRVAARDFFRGPFDVDLGPQDVLTELRVPKTGGAGWSYLKFHTRAQDWAIVGVAAVVRNGGAAVGLVNMGGTPLRAEAVERALTDGAGPEEASRAAAEGTSPSSDVFASADYRRAVAPVLVRRALEEALSGGRAGRGGGSGPGSAGSRTRR